jgi:prevent-host-death family protein
MTSAISLDEFRKNLSDIVGKVMYGNQTVRVRKHNRMGVVVMSEREYEYLKDPRKHFSSKKDWDELFVLTDAVRARMSKKDQEALGNIIDEEVKAVRVQKQQRIA